MTDFVYF